MTTEPMTIRDHRRRRARAQKAQVEQKITKALREHGELFVTGIEARADLGNDQARHGCVRLLEQNLVVKRMVKQFGTPPKPAYRLVGQPPRLQDGSAINVHGESSGGKERGRRSRMVLNDGEQVIRGQIVALINASLPDGLTREDIALAIEDQPGELVRGCVRKLWDANELSYRGDGTYVTNRRLRS